jgi:DNA repair protein RAD50
VLKKKFDDIFAATRYTKALEAFKSIRKDGLVEIKLDHQELDHLKIDKEKAEKVTVAIV